jgi:uncharacterized protein YhbP (UPF0306 family)
MIRDPRQLALAYLAGHQVMTLATTGPAGLWAAAVFYASAGFRLYFLSAGHTRHAQNVTSTGYVAATIQEDYRDWPDIQGLQLSGPVRLLSGAEREQAILIYQQKYPFIAQADGKMETALARVNWYQLEPDALFFVDNRLGLGHRDEISLP